MPGVVSSSISFSSRLEPNQTSVQVLDLVEGTTYNCSVWGVSDEQVGASRSLTLSTDIAGLSLSVV